MKRWLVFTENTDYERVGTWSLIEITAEDPRTAVQRATDSKMGYGKADAHAIVFATDCVTVFELEEPHDLLVGPQVGLENVDISREEPEA